MEALRSSRQRTRSSQSATGLLALRVALAVLLSGALVAGCSEDAAPGPWVGVVEFRTRDLGAEAGGRILAIPVMEGAAIAAGDVAFQLDPTLQDARVRGAEARLKAVESRLALALAGPRAEVKRELAAAAAKAEARLDEARAERQLMQDRAAREAATAEEVAVVEAAVRSATAALDEARARQSAAEAGSRAEEIEEARADTAAARATLELLREESVRLAVRSPIAGHVVARNREPGEVVAMGEPVVSVADTTRPEVILYVPERDLPLLALGTRVGVALDGRPGELIAGMVSYLAPTATFTPRYTLESDERSGLRFQVKVQLEAPAGSVHAGLPATVHLAPPP